MCNETQQLQEFLQDKKSSNQNPNLFYISLQIIYDFILYNNSLNMNQVANLITQLYIQYLPAQYRWRPRPGLNRKQTFQIFNQLKKRCFKCGGRIVPQGHGRQNGADRIEWEKRRTHVKCYKKAKKQNIFGFFQVEENQRQEGDNPFQDILATTLEVFADRAAQ